VSLHCVPIAKDPEALPRRAQVGKPTERGRPEAGREVTVPWKDGVHCQHFFPPGPGAQYFEIARVGSQSESQTPSVQTRFETDKQELARALKNAKEEERRQIIEPEEAKEPNSWLCRVGWVDHLGHLTRRHYGNWLHQSRKMNRSCKYYARHLIGWFKMHSTMPFGKWWGWKHCLRPTRRR
jgi:hypothetical protein